tara:strand:+ start:423 stop:2147 length:1725 start_codon:yes stop_codon:yes gene_type:complete
MNTPKIYAEALRYKIIFCFVALQSSSIFAQNQFDPNFSLDAFDSSFDSEISNDFDPELSQDINQETHTLSQHVFNLEHDLQHLFQFSSKQHWLHHQNKIENAKVAKNSESTLRFDVYSEGGTLEFNLALSELQGEQFIFFINDDAQLSINENQNTTSHKFNLPDEGRITLKWVFKNPTQKQSQAAKVKISDIILNNTMDYDSDGLHDAWEYKYIDTLTEQAFDDTDSDELKNQQEFDYGTHPDQDDTDKDGYLDGWEVRRKFNPLKNDTYAITEYIKYQGPANYDAGLSFYDQKEFKEAFLFIEEAAQTNKYVKAQLKLAQMYAEGVGTTQNEQEAIKWYRTASQNLEDDGSALYEYALLHEGHQWLAQDHDALFKLMHQSAKKRYAPAQYYLGNAYFNGNLISKDERKSFYWYEQAAIENNFFEAQLALAKMYDSGSGTQQNTRKATQWYQIAAHNPNNKNLAIQEMDMRTFKIQKNMSTVQALRIDPLTHNEAIGRIQWAKKCNHINADKAFKLMYSRDLATGLIHRISKPVYPIYLNKNKNRMWKAPTTHIKECSYGPKNKYQIIQYVFQI